MKFIISVKLFFSFQSFSLLILHTHTNTPDSPSSSELSFTKKLIVMMVTGVLRVGEKSVFMS